jgi:hypothetical protein
MCEKAKTRDTESFFRDWVTSIVTRLNPVRFFTIGLLKGEVYTNKPCTIDNLESFTRRLQPFLWTCYNMYSPIWSTMFSFACMDARGDDFQHLT